MHGTINEGECSKLRIQKEIKTATKDETRTKGKPC
jgi:hypothetical protein